MSRYFWLSDEQWAVIEPLLPKVHTGPERVDDRRIISGILHRLREGCRWRAVPEVYGPCTTVFNRYNRWSKRGLWQGIFAGLVGCNDPPAVTMIDSTAVEAHRSSAGARRSPEKGGSRAGHRPFTRWPDDQDPRDRRRCGPPACTAADRRQRRRHHRCVAIACRH